MSADISIIVRCWNAATTLERALQSVLSQTSASRTEVIVVDDASSDGTWAVIGSYGTVVRAIRNERNRGAIAAAHVGLALTGGKYVMLVDADDWVEPELVEALAKALDEAPAAALAYCDYVEEYPGGQSRIVAPRGRILDFVACNTMFRRFAVLDTGFWDERFLLPEYDLIVRLILSGHHCAAVPRPLYHYVRHTASMTHLSGFQERALSQLQDHYGPLSSTGRIEDLTISDCRAAADNGDMPRGNR